MTLSNEETFRRETARDCLCAILSNAPMSQGVTQIAKQNKIHPDIVMADMAISQAEVFIARLKLCRHKNIGSVQVENIDGTKTCPDCGQNLK